MGKGTVTVWWYERDNGDLRSESFSGGVPTGGSYEHEVDVKFARDAVRKITVHANGLGMDAFPSLKAEADAYRQKLGAPPKS